MRILLTVLLLALASPAWAATYYISPTGVDGAAGTSGAPWRTFARAIATGTPKLVAGDTLILKNGTYTSADSGMLVIDCTVGANSGTTLSPITVIAENERQAYIKLTTGTSAVRVTGCSNWVVQGLRVGTESPTNPDNVSLMRLQNSTNITFRKNLTHRSEEHILIYPSTNTGFLIEDHEGYEYEFGLVHVAGAVNGVIRRCYGHNRGLSGTFTGNPAHLVVYPKTNTGVTVENCIFESATTRPAAAIQESALSTTSGNKYLGIIVVSGSQFVTEYRTSSSVSRLPTNTVVRNMVHILGNDAPSHAFHPVAPSGGLYENISLFYASNISRSGFFANNSAACEGGATCSPATRGFTARNMNIQNFPATGFLIDSEAQSWPSWSASYINAFGNGTNFSPSAHANMNNLTEVNPLLGNCRVWIPDTSPLSGSGSSAGGSGVGYTKTSGDGASQDKGATVLYAYVNGQLTTTKLWNPSTGAWAHGGATVTGINDVAGQSLANVHLRLNVGAANGCALPTSYTTIPPASPFVTAVLDNFNRSNEGPPPSASWTNLGGTIGGGASQGISVSSNEAIGNVVAGLHTSRWNTSFTANQEVYANIASPPSQDGLAAGAFFCRVTDEDNFYRVNLLPVAGANNDQFVVIKEVAGVATTLATFTMTADFANTDEVGIRCVGTTIEAYRQGELAGSVTDSTYTAAGYIGLGIFAQRIQFDNFGGGSLDATDGVAPTTPANCVATPVSSTQNDLVCDASTDAVGIVNYRDEQCDGAACVDFAEIRATSALNYSDTGLVASTLYRYRRRAWDGTNFSSYSSIFEATTLAGADVTAPTAPTDLRAQRISTGAPLNVGVRLTWTAATDAVGVTQNRVERGDVNCTNFTEISIVGGVVQEIEVEVPRTEGRCYRVRAGDLAGNLGNYSNNAVVNPDLSGGRIR